MGGNVAKALAVPRSLCAFLTILVLLAPAAASQGEPSPLSLPHTLYLQEPEDPSDQCCLSLRSDLDEPSADQRWVEAIESPGRNDGSVIEYLYAFVDEENQTLPSNLWINTTFAASWAYHTNLENTNNERGDFVATLWIADRPCRSHQEILRGDDGDIIAAFVADVSKCAPKDRALGTDDIVLAFRLTLDGARPGEVYGTERGLRVAVSADGSSFLTLEAPATGSNSVAPVDQPETILPSAESETPLGPAEFETERSQGMPIWIIVLTVLALALTGLIGRLGPSRK